MPVIEHSNSRPTTWRCVATSMIRNANLASIFASRSSRTSVAPLNHVHGLVQRVGLRQRLLANSFFQKKSSIRLAQGIGDIQCEKIQNIPISSGGPAADVARQESACLPLSSFRCGCRTAEFCLTENCKFLAEGPPRMSRGRNPLVYHFPVSAVDVAQQNFA